MAEAAREIMVRKVSRPARGERVAAATETFMQARGLSIPELAFQAQVDKRDLQRLIRERSCGARLEDDLAFFFGWDFSEAVMSAVHGADPLTAREAQLERQLAEAAALQARIERERALRASPAPRLGLVASEPHLSSPRAPGERRTFPAPTPAPD